MLSFILQVVRGANMLRSTQILALVLGPEYLTREVVGPMRAAQDPIIQGHRWPYLHLSRGTLEELHKR